MRVFTVVHKSSRPNNLIKINRLSDIKVVDCDEENVARPDGRYTAERNKKKD